MAVGKKQGFQLKDFDEMHERSTAVSVRDRTFFKYLPYVQSYAYFLAPDFRRRENNVDQFAFSTILQRLTTEK